jgi:hypothetical protein
MIYYFSVSADGPQKAGERRETYPQNPRRVYELENEPKSGRQEDTGVRLVPTRIKDRKPRQQLIKQPVTIHTIALVPILVATSSPVISRRRVKTGTLEGEKRAVEGGGGRDSARSKNRYVIAKRKAVLKRKVDFEGMYSGFVVEKGGTARCSWGVLRSRRLKVQFKPNFRRLRIVSWTLLPTFVDDLLLEWAGGRGFAEGGCNVGPLASKLHFRRRDISRKFMTNKMKHETL